REDSFVIIRPGGDTDSSDLAIYRVGRRIPQQGYPARSVPAGSYAETVFLCVERTLLSAAFDVDSSQGVRNPHSRDLVESSSLRCGCEDRRVSENENERYAPGWPGISP